MKRSISRILFVVSIALAAVFCAASIVQTVRLSDTEKQLSIVRKEASRVGQLQSKLDDLTKKYNKILNSGTAYKETNTKIAYLTFDDGPSKNTPLLLQTLQSLNVKATFFVIGLNCQRFPNEVKAEAAAGNVVGIHSWTHNYPYIYANMNNFKQDFNELRDYLTQQMGTAPTICRFPGGTNNTVFRKYTKEAIMQEAVQFAQSQGVRPIDWDADAGDAEIPIPTKDQIVQRITKEIGHKTRPIILMHDFGNRTSTIEAIPAIVQALKAQGYSFSTLADNDTFATMFKPRSVA